MTDNTTIEAAGSKQANTDKPGPRSTKRRIAREPKAGGNAPSNSTPVAATTASATTTKERRGSSKISSVVALLQRSGGATLAEMVDATGWLPHTTRAALTGLKKKGHIITKDKRGDVTCYHIAKVG